MVTDNFRPRIDASLANANDVLLKPARRSVLFVCWANVCRSPAGKSVLQSFLATKALEPNFHIDSAGVGYEENLPKPSLAMRWVTFRRGYKLSSRPRRINRLELEDSRLVIALDRRVRQALEALHRNPKSTIKLLSDFLPAGWPVDVPDPMNRNRHVCNRVFDMLERACPRIVESMLQPNQANLLVRS